jgi:uncharacterized protein
MFQWSLWKASMQLPFSDEVILDSRRAVYLVRTETLVLADLFLGLGAARRRRPDPFPTSQHNDLWERLLGLLDEYKPKRVALLGDVKPNQGHVEDEEAEELRTLFRKLGGQGRDVIQVVGHPERAQGPALEDLGVRPVESHAMGVHTLIHRRRIFVYPRHDPPYGFWINGGVHPLFCLPTVGPDGTQDWGRYPAFLYTGFALVMPPFVSYAQGWEVMQPERLPRQARAWKVVGDNQLSPLSLPDLPAPPEHLRTLRRTQPKRRRPEEE